VHCKVRRETGGQKLRREEAGREKTGEETGEEMTGNLPDPAGTFALRPYEPADAEALAAAYRAAVTGLGPAAYDPAHVAVWASYPEDIEVFRERLMRGVTMVAEAGGRPAGFAQLDPP